MSLKLEANKAIVIVYSKRTHIITRIRYIFGPAFLIAYLSIINIIF